MGLQADVEDGLLCLKDNIEELLIFEYLYYHLENVSKSEVGGELVQFVDDLSHIVAHVLVF